MLYDGEMENKDRDTGANQEDRSAGSGTDFVMGTQDGAAPQGSGSGPDGYQSQVFSESGNGYRSQVPPESGNGYRSQVPSEGGNGYQGVNYPNQSARGGWEQQAPAGNGYAGQTFSGNGNNWNQPYQGGGGNRGPGDGGGYRQAQPEEPKKKKKKHPVLKKTAGIVAAALLFGVIAGGTIAGVNMLADSLQKETTAAAEGPTQSPTLSDEELAKIADNLNLKSGSGTAVMDVSGIVEQAMPSVVAINNTVVYQMNNPWFGGSRTYESVGSGSGIIVGKNDTELLIVTNNHVIENASELKVTFIDQQAVDATVKGTDSESDLAIVTIPLKDIPAETMSKISVAEMGNSDNLKVGQGVVAIGNALGYGQSVTVGYISALDREVTTEENITRHLLQTDAAINPGNSGGALLNMQGQVIGINAAKYTDTQVEGMGYAIPSSQAESIIDTLMVRRSGEKVAEGQEGYLGIQGLTVDDSMVQQFDMPAGVYVYRILEDGAAAKTDLREKDVITKFDGQCVRTMASLLDLLQYYKIGEQVEMVVESLENGEYVERTITITLGAQGKTPEE